MTAEKVPASQELSYSLTVADAMRGEVIKVGPSITMRALRKVLKEKNISGAPVVSKGRLLGVISLEDLINSMLSGEMDLKVERKMTRDIQCCHPDDQLIRAIQIFEKTGYGRLPVVDRGSGKLVGIITKGDIVLSLLRKLEAMYDEQEFSLHKVCSPLYTQLKGDFIFEQVIEVKALDFKNAGRASSAFRESMTRFGIPPDVVRRASICAYESEMNMVIYSKGGHMSITIRRDRMTIKALDHGPGIEDLDKAMTPGYSTAPDWVREMGFGAGMGLPNIKNNADKLNVKTCRNANTRIFIEVDLP